MQRVEEKRGLASKYKLLNIMPDRRQFTLTYSGGNFYQGNLNRNRDLIAALAVRNRVISMRLLMPIRTLSTDLADFALTYFK